MTIRSFDVSFSDDPQNSDDALRESHRLPQSTLDALLANIAILDEHATIIAVNAAWRFAEANCYIGAAYGTNYLEVCDSRSRGGCWESCGCGTAPCKRMTSRLYPCSRARPPMRSRTRGLFEQADRTQHIAAVGRRHSFLF
jgi:hypothetical protein